MRPLQNYFDCLLRGRLLQRMTVFTTNPDYESCDQQTTHNWMAKVFSSDDTCLLEYESLTLEEEIGEGAFGKVFRGLICIVGETDVVVVWVVEVVAAANKFRHESRRLCKQV